MRFLHPRNIMNIQNFDLIILTRYAYVFWLKNPAGFNDDFWVVFFNMWVVTKETPKEVFATLHQYIKHLHLKDASLVNGKHAYCLIGQGVAPLTEAMDSLKEANYKGYYSFEWEKKWHPEIQEPDIAFPHFAKEIIHYL